MRVNYLRKDLGGQLRQQSGKHCRSEYPAPWPRPGKQSPNDDRAQDQPHRMAFRDRLHQGTRGIERDSANNLERMARPPPTQCAEQQAGAGDLLECGGPIPAFSDLRTTAPLRLPAWHHAAVLETQQDEPEGRVGSGVMALPPRAAFAGRPGTGHAD